MNYADDLQALASLRNYLTSQLTLTAAYSVTFAQWGGVWVLTQDEERAGRGGCKPRAVFSLYQGMQSNVFTLQGARDCEAYVEIKADEFEGGSPKAGPGGSAPVQVLGADALLSKALLQVLDESDETQREALRALGFYRVEVKPQREVTRNESGAAQVQVDPHRVLFTYLRPE